MNNREGRKNLDALQIARAVELLRQHFDVDGRSYHTGWGDERIANEVKCNNNQIAVLRVKHFGKLIASSKTTEVTELRERLNTLCRDFLQLAIMVRNIPSSTMTQAMIKSLQDKYDLPYTTTTEK